MKRLTFICILFYSICLYSQENHSQLIEAFKSDSIQLLNVEITNGDINKCYDTEHGEYTLLVLSIKTNATSIFDYLIKNDANLDFTCFGKTPLMYAAKYGRLKMLKSLIENGADVNMSNENNTTVLDYVLRYNQEEIEEYLKSIGICKMYELDGIDGPYIIDDSIFTITKTNKLSRKKISVSEPIEVLVNGEDGNRFNFFIQNKHSKEIAIYSQPEKLIAISDIEGNYEGLYSFLLNNEVIDTNCMWIFGNGHLILNGDFVDRNDHVTEVLWLIYSLENKAEECGGKVHFILGNHEVMNINGDIRYVYDKYVAAAKKISRNDNAKQAYKFMYSEKSEIGKWLRSKNIIEQVGDYIFVHAGLSPEIVKLNLSIEEINKACNNYFDIETDNKKKDDVSTIILDGGESLIWYRGLVMDFFNKKKVSEAELDKVLAYYGAKKIVIGHTIVDDISTDYNGKVIRIDVKHGTEKNSGKTKGLLIEDGVEYKIDDLGNKEKI